MSEDGRLKETPLHESGFSCQKVVNETVVKTRSVGPPISVLFIKQGRHSLQHDIIRRTI